MKKFKVEVFLVALTVIGFCTYFIVNHPNSWWDSPLIKAEDEAEAILEADIGLPAGSIDLNKDRKK